MKKFNESLCLNSKSIKRFLNKKIYFKDIYYFFVTKFTGMNVTIKESDYYKFYFNYNDEAVLNQELNIKNFHKIYCLIKNKELNYEVNFHKSAECLWLKTPDMKELPPVFNMIKWNIFKTEFIKTARDYVLDVDTQINDVGDLSITNSVNNISYSDIALERRVLVTDEIVQFMPYTRKILKSKLYKIPIDKKPCIKLSFSTNQLKTLRENLATQNKTITTNVDIISIYDKMDLNLYSNLKPDTKGKGLSCYLNPLKQNEKSQSMYYLIIGKKRDSKSSIKALVLMDKIS